MGKKTKTGKGRLDKFYHLAKEQGFRARSAFKLTQLARQYNLFARANVCVDLCGAPGGWSQVAVQAMPKNSKVICVDLVPIKPLKGVSTIQSDITTQQCRNLIKAELSGKTHVCDIVLNDGAPNVGAAWSKDAYNQAELTLHAFQLACDLLRPGGTFVTKVFRSADYNSLLWAFQQLFNKVESSKPSASRAVSAEIFVVCQGFKAPSKIDPKFFNPKFVFMSEEALEPEDEDEGVSATTPAHTAEKPSSLSGLLKAMGKRNRGGYAEGDDFRTVTVDEFLASRNPAELLIKCHKILVPKNSTTIVPATLLSHFDDIKVLGKGELYSIMKWRTKALNDLKKSSQQVANPSVDKADDSESGSDDDTSSQSGVEEDDELARLVKSRMAEEKRELKRQRAKEKKSLMRKKMSLDHGVVGIAETTSASFEPDLFHLPNIREKSEIISKAMEDAPVVLDEDDMNLHNGIHIPEYEIVERNSEELISKYEKEFSEDYQIRKEMGLKTTSSAAPESASRGKKITRRQKHMAEWAAEVDALGDDIDKKAALHYGEQRADDAPSSDEDDDEQEGVPTLQPIRTGENEDQDEEEDIEEGDENVMNEKTSKPVKIGQSSVLADRWFSNPIFAPVSREGDDSDGEAAVSSGKGRRQHESIKELAESDLPVIPLSDKQEKKRKRKEKNGLSNGGNNGTNGGDDIEVVAPQTFEERPSLDEIAEVQAMGSLMVSKRSRMALIDSGFNRYSYDDTAEDLPDWFKEEEEKFNRKQLPLTKELMQQYRAKLREINARPIRKEAEAQGRRKRRMERKMASLKQQAASLVGGEDDDPFGGQGSIHKAKQIVKNMKAVKREGKRKTVFLAVQRKGGSSKQVGGEGGKGAKVAMVDRRLKKDRRAQRNASRRNSRR